MKINFYIYDKVNNKLLDRKFRSYYDAVKKLVAYRRHGEEFLIIPTIEDTND